MILCKSVKMPSRWSKPVFMHQNNSPDLRKSLKRRSRMILMFKQVVQLLSGVSLSKFLQFLYFFSAATYCSRRIRHLCFFINVESGLHLSVFGMGNRTSDQSTHCPGKSSIFLYCISWKLLVFPLMFISLLIYALFYSVLIGNLWYSALYQFSFEVLNSRVCLFQGKRTCRI